MPLRILSQACPCKRRMVDAPVTNPAHQLLVREGSLDGRGGRLSAAQVGEQGRAAAAAAPIAAAAGAGLLLQGRVSV